MAGDGNIVGSLIGACGGIVAGALSFALTALSNRRAQHLSARREAFLGRWEGKASDFYVEDASKPRVTFTLIVTFTSVGRTVKADGVLQLPGSAKGDELALSGAFYNDDYMQLSCQQELRKETTRSCRGGTEPRRVVSTRILHRVLARAGDHCCR